MTQEADEVDRIVEAWTAQRPDLDFSPLEVLSRVDRLSRHLDRARREAILFKIQQLMVERAIFVPIWQLAFLNGVGPRVGESGFGRIALFPYTAPYEDITLKSP